ncbi:serine hydrolase domain-containing protein [Caldimonas tepidiphila]|uniref:serine hydrolase domain-containing protein n=1 Tax=Caldimonas tepidiphila TaxID=2315841 RepID=UPI00130042D4|nr:serine hydrolase [Caldimonas tepidiphila]
MRPRRLALPVLLAATLLGGCADLPLWMVAQQRSSIADHRRFDNAPIARAAQPSPLPAEPQAALRLPQGAAGESFDARLERNGTVAFVVVQRGRVVHERYFHGFERDSLGTSFSVAKSVVSALVGIALHEGRIGSVDDPITRYLPELLRNDARFADVTLRHLLEMRSGIAFEEGYRTPWADAARFYLTPELAPKVAGLRIGRPAGEAYHYSSGDTQLLGMAIERATGMPLARYAEQRLWQPMGAAFDASWSLDSAAQGQAKAFCCLNARALDFARLGLVFLHGGRFNGQQVVPADWVAQSTAARERPAADSEASRWNLELPGTPLAAFYAWQWRRHPVAAPGTPLGVRPGPNFYARGQHGQYVFVAPQQEMVIVRLGRERGTENWPALLDELAALNPPAAPRQP